MLFDLFVYAWKYLVISVHAGRIWGMVSTVEENNARLETLYPKEWRELQALREKHNIPKTGVTGV